jgi:hypothetical protein
VDSGWNVAEHATRYRAITRFELTTAAASAGFADITWLPPGQLPIDQQVMTATRRL